MLNEKQYSEILEELDNCNRPLYFFHDDADGLSSFLLLYRYKREGKGVCVKSRPRVDDRFFKIVEDYAPDKIFILDLAILSEDFAHKFRRIPIIWIDHHSPSPIKGVKYFNPRVSDSADNTCVSELCYNVVKECRDDDLWIAAAGIIGDWQMSDTTRFFSTIYPELLPPIIQRPEKAMFNSPYSKMIKILNFILKGRTQDVMKCVKIMTRIESPQELLLGESARAKFILRRFNRINALYERLVKFAMKSVSRDRILLVNYTDEKMSFTGELSNELLYRYPKKIIVVAREKSDEMKCSLRSGSGVDLRGALEIALQGVEGYGGGHEHACGACIKSKDFDDFLDNLREAVDAQDVSTNNNTTSKIPVKEKKTKSIVGKTQKTANTAKKTRKTTS